MNHNIDALVSMSKGQQTNAYLKPKKIQSQDQECFYKFKKQKEKKKD